MDALNETHVELEESAVDAAVTESFDVPAFLDPAEAGKETGEVFVQSDENF